MKAIHVLVLALILSLLAAGLALANGGVELAQEVVGSGASVSGAEDIEVQATLGQPMVGSVFADTGDIVLSHGFWPGGAPAQYKNYLPLVLRSGP